MTLLYSEEQRLLADSAREFLAARSPVSLQRALRDEQRENGFDAHLWQDAVALGWSAIPFPENLGGLDFGCMGLGPEAERDYAAIDAGKAACEKLFALLDDALAKSGKKK